MAGLGQTTQIGQGTTIPLALHQYGRIEPQAWNLAPLVHETFEAMEGHRPHRKTTILRNRESVIVRNVGMLEDILVSFRVTIVPLHLCRKPPNRQGAKEQAVLAENNRESPPRRILDLGMNQPILRRGTTPSPKVMNDESPPKGGTPY